MCRNIVCNHTDTSLLPPLSDRRDLNLLRLPSTSVFSKGSSSSELCVPTSFAMATQILPGQLYDSPNLLLQTTNLAELGQLTIIIVEYQVYIYTGYRVQSGGISTREQ